MAGSIKWVRYVSDSGQIYSVKLDESNAIAGGFDDQGDGQTTGEFPRGSTMRYVNCQHAESGAKRRVYLGKPLNPLRNGGTVNLILYSGTQATVVPFQVTSYRGEQRRLVFAVDTALNDGTAT